MADALIPLSKRCWKCAELKPDTDYPMRSAKRFPGMRDGMCNQCRAQATRDHRAKERAEFEAAKPWLKYKHVTQEMFMRTTETRRSILRRFGITLEGYCEMVEARGNACDICGGQSSDRNLAVDHCHSTGVIRGLLCNSCNLGLGMLGDDSASVERALSYLLRTGKREAA